MLRDDERPAQRNHHENSKQSTKYGDEHYARDLEIESKYQDCRHRDSDAERDRLTRGARRLYDIVLKDRRFASAEPREKLEQRDGDDGDRDRRAYRQSDLENEVKRRRSEDQAEQGPHDQRQRCQLTEAGH